MISPSTDQAAPVKQTEWFAEQVQPHEPALRSYLRAAFPALRDLDDVVQESYVRVWRRHVSRPIQSTKAFLFTVARRLVFDGLRRERRSPIEAGADVSALNAPDSRPTGVEHVSEAEKVELLILAIDALPARCRDVVILRKLQLVSQREVAAQLGISEKGVEIQLARGLGRCRAFLEARGMRSLFGDDLT